MTEQWRPIPGFDGVYEVSDLGRVRSLEVRLSNGRRRRRPTPRVLRPYSDHGYLRVWLMRAGRGAGYRVHRLVLEAFVGPCPPGHEAAHLNGRRTDNRLPNLAWLTHQANVAHQRIHGTLPIGDRNGLRRHPEARLFGERHPGARLTSAQVAEIRRRRGRDSTRALAKEFGVSQATISKVLLGKTWSTVEAPHA